MESRGIKLYQNYVCAILKEHELIGKIYLRILLNITQIHNFEINLSKFCNRNLKL